MAQYQAEVKEVEETPKQQQIEVYMDGEYNDDKMAYEREVHLYADIVGFQSDRNFFGIMNKAGETFGIPISKVQGFRSFFVEV